MDRSSGRAPSDPGAGGGEREDAHAPGADAAAAGARTPQRLGGGPGPGALDRSLQMAVGVRSAKKLAALGLHTVRDLLEHYPRRAVDPGELSNLADLRPGQVVVVIVDVASFTAHRRQNGPGLVVTVSVTDGDGAIDLVFFAKSAGHARALESQLRPGRRITVDGTVTENRWASRNRAAGRGPAVLQIVHPEIEEIDDALSEREIQERATRPRLRYGLTRGLTNRAMSALILGRLALLGDEDLPDPVPYEVRVARGLMHHAEALRAIHSPETMASYRAARAALRYEEAFVLQAAMARRRAEVVSQPATPRPVRPGGLLDTFDASLPFVLTRGQLDVGGQISAELAGATPMQRLLQGEVGSGKTLVALRAMLQVVDAGGQAALLAPTEVLASQHERSLRELLGPLAEGGMLGGRAGATRVVLLTGSLTPAQRRARLAEIASGAAGIVIGTHALLQDRVQFADLALVVVDEQHRFGVEQRDLLRAKGRTVPHLLVMTATPIPRTVAMTVFGDLEISTLRELPEGRAEVVTHVVDAHNAAWVERMWQRVAEEVAQGRRAYVVCPRIEAGERGVVGEVDDGAEGSGVMLAMEGEDSRELASVAQTVEALRERPELAGVPLGVLHGRLSGEEKEAAMAAFASGAVPVLVTTTVVEVGVDVRTASVMIVLDADRFGLSQLHQLRGRIGRSDVPGVCLVVSAAQPGTPSRQRLETFAGTCDGFVLAEADLAQRREGDVLGAAQHGRSSLRLLRVVTDQRVIAEAREDARVLVAGDPQLHDHAELAAAIDRTLGEREEYLERT